MNKFNYQRYWIILLSILVLLSICYFDYFTGGLGFFVFYFIPIILLSWYLGKWYGVGMSIASSVCWLLADYFCNVRYSNIAVAVWDTLVVRGGAFIIAAIAISNLRDVVEKHKKLNKELGAALFHLKQLKKMMQFCAVCKDKGRDNCYLDKIEAYINHHSEMKPDLGEPPECILKTNPELWEKINDELKT